MATKRTKPLKGSQYPTYNPETSQDNPWGSEYHPDMCLQIIEMFSDGDTAAAFCAHHTICSDTYEKWRKKYPLFDRACIVAHDKARFYYDKMRKDYLIQEKDGKFIHWPMFNRMYNVRFNLADKRRVKVKGFGSAKDEKEMTQSLTRAIEAGDLTPDEGQKLATLIEVSLKVKQTQELEHRIDVLETAHKTGLD